MEKIVIKINEIDKILNIPTPNWLPKDWYKENENPFDWFDEIDRPFLENTTGMGRYTLNFPSNLVKFETNPTSNYFYFIHKTPSDFFDNKIFNKYINDDVLSDIKNNKCKIVFYMDDDGKWGEKVPYFYNDDTLDILNQWVIKNNFTKEQVYFLSHNCFLEPTDKKNKFTPISCSNLQYTSNISNHHQRKYPLYVNYHHCGFITEDSFTYDFNKIEKIFLSYNKNIGPHRFYFMYSLLKNNLINDFLYSFVENNTDEDCVDKINNYLTDKSKKILDANIIEKINSIIGSEIISKNPNKFKGDYYGQYLQLEDYEKTFMSVVTESNVGTNTIYFSEKTIKCLLTRHPFILISSPYSLKKLKEFGFKTFDKWWDESYDNCEHFIDRIDKITEIIKLIQKKPKKELIKIRKEMQDILLHNQTVLLKKDGLGWMGEIKNIKF